MLPTIDPALGYIPIAKLKDVAASLVDGKLAHPLLVLDTNFRPVLVVVGFDDYQKLTRELAAANDQIARMVAERDE